MSAPLESYAYGLFGLFVLFIYIALVLLFLRLHTQRPDDPVKWWWHVLVGPPALLKWYSHKLGRRSLVSRRETLGWLIVLALMIVVVAWKLASKP
jgi:hypothetical protein